MIKISATKRLNVLRVLARNGVEPVVLLKLYKMYIRSIMEYGSFCFIAAPKIYLSKLQKTQNDALRVCLRLPSFIRIGLLHECASIETFEERMLKLNSNLLRKMYRHNPDIKFLVGCYFSEIENYSHNSSPISTVRPIPELFTN